MPTITFDNTGTQRQPNIYIEDGLSFSSPDSIIPYLDIDGDGFGEVRASASGAEQIEIRLTSGGKFSLLGTDTFSSLPASLGPVRLIGFAYNDAGVLVRTGETTFVPGGHV